MSINLTADTEVWIQGLLVSELRPELTVARRPGHYSIELRFTFRGENDDEWDPDDLFVSRDIELLVDGETLLLMEEYSRLGINCDHPVLKPFEIAESIKAVAYRWPEFVSMERGWGWVHGQVRLDENKHLDAGHLRYEWEGHAQHYIEEKPLRAIPPEVLQLLHELALFHNTLMDIVLRNVWGHLHSAVAPASRTIPLDDQLVFVVGGIGGNVEEKFHLTTPGAQEFQSLADSFGARLHREQLSSSSRRDSDYAENVNRMLTDYLFLERGYRIDMDYRVILSPGEFGDATESGHDRRPGEFSLLIRLFLTDAQGRTFSFTEVGSGLGYVLPVLVAVWKPFGGIAILQQPELHLHPALQAALGDVLIESSNHKRLIVETHSEHILLRVLKRIRQSHFKDGVPDGLTGC
jgi:putative AbiEii toxin of type IV toxin-antitoxin system